MKGIANSKVKIKFAKRNPHKLFSMIIFITDNNTTIIIVGIQYPLRDV
ncbi:MULTISPECIES: hypothetical protein [unclassified Gemella]|nr:MULTISPECIES: hypothetical protein [unclassified Gemella]